jgi:two-component system, OmpR family, copper resistance phosphate regulon response regulator CusR
MVDAISPPHVLVVEDYGRVAKGICDALTGIGCTVQSAASGDEGSLLACSTQYDVVILDLMLPGQSGFDVLREMRDQGIETPVIILTARDSLEDRLRGFRDGADDYLSKPFALPELLARVRALLHRTRPQSISKLRVADLELDLILRRAFRSGRAIDLAPREFELLAFLMSHTGAVVSREMLGQNVWKQLARGTPLQNVIDVHISRLRHKIDEEFNPKLLHTVRGLGFRLYAGELQ